MVIEEIDPDNWTVWDVIDETRQRPVHNSRGELLGYIVCKSRTEKRDGVFHAFHCEPWQFVKTYYDPDAPQG